MGGMRCWTEKCGEALFGTSWPNRPNDDDDAKKLTINPCFLSLLGFIPSSLPSPLSSLHLGPSISSFSSSISLFQSFLHLGSFLSLSLLSSLPWFLLILAYLSFLPSIHPIFPYFISVLILLPSLLPLLYLGPSVPFLPSFLPSFPLLSDLYSILPLLQFLPSIASFPSFHSFKSFLPFLFLLHFFSFARLYVKQVNWSCSELTAEQKYLLRLKWYFNESLS